MLLVKDRGLIGSVSANRLFEGRVVLDRQKYWHVTWVANKFLS